MIEKASGDEDGLLLNIGLVFPSYIGLRLIPSIEFIILRFISESTFERRFQ